MLFVVSLVAHLREVAVRTAVEVLAAAALEPDRVRLVLLLAEVALVRLVRVWVLRKRGIKQF